METPLSARPKGMSFIMIPFSNCERHGKWVMSYHTPSLLAASLYYCIDNIGHHIGNRNYRIKRVDYNSFLLLVTVSGRGTLVYEGVEYEANNNNAVFINCMKKHEYFPKDDAWDFYWAHFSGAMSAEYFDHLFKLNGPVVNIRYSGLNYAETLENILHLKKSADINFEPKASDYISSMLNALIIASGKTLENEAENISQKFSAAIDFIKENYMKNIHVDDIANAALVSPYHFIRIFKKATGFSPYEYLIKYRISRAKILITHSEDSVQDIAQAVGFSSVNNFIATFKKYENITPYHFRRSNSFI